MTPNGIDMYHGDNREDAGLSDDALTSKFQAMLENGIFWVMHKVSEGANIQDARYIRRRELAKRAGIKFFGGYHFLNNTGTDAQLKNFLTAAEDDGAMCFAVDYEKSGYTPSSYQLLGFLRDFYAEMKLRSKIYGGNLVRETIIPHMGGHRAANMVASEIFFSNHDLWLAEYGPHANVPYPWATPQGSQKKPSGVWAWQFSGLGRLPELVGNTDLNYFDGTPDSLASRWRA